MSRATNPADHTGDSDDPFEPIREHEDEIKEAYADREDRMGAIARYLLAAAHGDIPDDYDAELAGLPKLSGDNP